MNNHWYQVSRYEIHLDIPKSFRGYRIVHLSDIHDHKLSKRFYDKLRKLQPDIVVITGDVIDSSNFNLKRCIDNLKDIHYPMYYVIGNHEIGSKRLEEILSALEDLKINILDNECCQLIKNDEQIDLFGVSNRSRPNLEVSQFTILLGHRSEMINYYKRIGAHLVLSGHAHGGQFRLFSKGLYAPDQGWLPKYTSGLHVYGKTHHIINRGIGNSSLKLRLFNRPEIGLIILEKKG